MIINDWERFGRSFPIPSKCFPLEINDRLKLIFSCLFSWSPAQAGSPRQNQTSMVWCSNVMIFSDPTASWVVFCLRLWKGKVGSSASPVSWNIDLIEEFTCQSFFWGKCLRWFLLESLLTERFNFLLDHFLKIQVSSPSLPSFAGKVIITAFCFHTNTA